MGQNFVLQLGSKNVWYGTFKHFSEYNVLHAVSTRLHGHSKDQFKSLNLGINSGDSSDVVRANRQLFAEAVGFDLTPAVTAQQVHGDNIAVVTATTDNYIEATDALITAEPGIPLLLFFADCVPVLFFSPQQRVVAVAHAGWKGTVSRIAAKTLQLMQAEFNVKPEQCLIGIGPSIGPCCYEVDTVVMNQFKQEFGTELNNYLTTKSEQHGLLNLWEVNRQQLLAVGASSKNIMLSSVCTACNTNLYYSHRNENGKTGRIGAVIQLP